LRARTPQQDPATSAADLPAPPRAAPGKRYHDRFPAGAASEQGFLLLEVIIAFVIAAIALAVLYHAGAAGLRSTAAAAHYEQAVARARSHLTLADHASPLMAGDWSGDDGGGYFWHLRVTPIASTTVRPITALALARSANFPLTLYAITVWITWHDIGATRVVRLTTEEIGQDVR